TRCFAATVRFTTPAAARWEAQQRLAARYRAEGHAAEAKDISITTLPMQGYKVVLHGAGLEIPLATRSQETNSKLLIGEHTLTYRVPESQPDLDTLLRTRPDYCAVTVTTQHPFREVLHTSASAELLRSAVQDLIEKWEGKKELILDRSGKVKFKQLLLQQVRL